MMPDPRRCDDRVSRHRRWGLSASLFHTTMLPSHCQIPHCPLPIAHCPLPVLHCPFPIAPFAPLPIDGAAARCLCTLLFLRPVAHRMSCSSAIGFACPSPVTVSLLCHWSSGIALSPRHLRRPLSLSKPLTPPIVGLAVTASGLRYIVCAGLSTGRSGELGRVCASRSQISSVARELRPVRR